MADDGDYVDAPGRIIQVLGGANGAGPRGRVLDPGEPSQPGPIVRWPADAPVIGEVKWAARTSCEE